MRFKLFVAAVLLTGLFIINGCNCACKGSATTCPDPSTVAAAH